MILSLNKTCTQVIVILTMTIYNKILPMFDYDYDSNCNNKNNNI